MALINDDDVSLQYGNLVYNKKMTDCKYHVTTKGLVNGGASQGMTLELYVSYAELGITDANSIKLCFNYNNVSSVGGVKSNVNNYLVKVSGNEQNIDAYFSISDLI